MSARPTECGDLEPESPSRALSAGAVERDHKLALQDVAILERVKCGALGKYLSGQDRSGRYRIQRDYLRGEGQYPRVPEETTSHRQPHRGALRL